jgi:hypothetical protein
VTDSPISPPIPADEGDRKVLADVREHGWHVVKVPDENESPGWAFSIGLHHSFSHPEIIIVGLPLDVMHRIINTIGSLIRTGRRFEHGVRSTNVVDDYTCAFSTVAPCWYAPLLGYAIWFYRGSHFPVLQCEWPDRDGRLPDDPRFNASLLHAQPLLKHSDAKSARMTAVLDSLQNDPL